MGKEFNQYEYINDYKKKNYKRYTAEVPKEISEDIDKIKKKQKLSNRQIFVKGYEHYKNKEK